VDKKGRWQAIFEALLEPDLDCVMLDSSVVRPHQHAVCQEKEIQTQKRSGAAEEPSLR
jgi:putative transposase